MSILTLRNRLNIKKIVYYGILFRLHTYGKENDPNYFGCVTIGHRRSERIIIEKGGKLYVLEAEGTVQLTPIQTFINGPAHGDTFKPNECHLH